MHKSYNAYNPVASKLLQKRWDEKRFNDHRSAVDHSKPIIDSTPPITFMHLHLKLKKLQLEEERLATIERDNRILLEKMAHTMRNKGQLDNINSAVPKSLSKNRRERELLRITKENANLLKRIHNKKPAIPRSKHEEEWQQNMIYMNNISAFSEDWYLKEKNNQKSKSAENLSKSGSSKESKDEDYDEEEFEEEQENDEEKDEIAKEEEKDESVKEEEEQAEDEKSKSNVDQKEQE